MKPKLILCLALVLGKTFVPNLHAQEKLAATIAQIDHDRILRLTNQANHGQLMLMF